MNDFKMRGNLGHFAVYASVNAIKNTRRALLGTIDGTSISSVFSGI